MTIALSEVARKAIDLHRRVEEEVRTQTVEELSGQIDWILTPPTPAQIELRKHLHNQPPAVVYGLIMIMYSGRGDITITSSNFRSQYEKATLTFNQPEHAVTQMLEKPLADYLERGLAKLSRSGIDF